MEPPPPPPPPALEAKSPRKSPRESPRHRSPPMSPTVAAGATRPDSLNSNPDMTRRGSHYDVEFSKRDSVANIRREVANHATALFHRDQDKQVHVFQEPPRIRVLSGRSEEAWPARYVEYDIELKYKNYTWQVEIPKSMMYGLWFFIKSTFQLKKANSSSGSAQIIQSQGGGSSYSTANLPPLRKLFLANAEKSISPDMINQIQDYLNAVVKVPRLRSSSYVVSMFQVSNSTFDEEEGYTSIREGWLKVRLWLKGHRDNVRVNRGAITCDNECFNCMCVFKRVNFKSKKWRWVALKHSSIAIYGSIQDERPLEAFLFDQKFLIERGIHSAGSNTALIVSNSTYVLQLEAKTKQSILKWANAIRKAAEISDWSQSHRDDSFAIPRHPSQFPSYARWFVDGKDAYESIFDSLLAAKKEIFIAGWWICPTIHLLRPAALYPHGRLDQVLLKKAEEGVKIYVLMYKEVSVALTLNSNFSKTMFRRLHPNVNVLRDPDFIMKQLGKWSHHEKIVSVDQKVSFVGGLDLCFGRWDDASHALFDQPDQLTNFQGKDYSNPRVKDFIDVHIPDKDLIDRFTTPRMPWHDCHSRLEGQAARDVARHFIQRWNFSVSTRRKKAKLHHLVPMNDYPKIVERDSGKLLNKRLQKAVRAVQALQGLRKLTMTSQESKEELEEKEPDNSSPARTNRRNREKPQDRDEPIASPRSSSPVSDKYIDRAGRLAPIPRAPTKEDQYAADPPAQPHRGFDSDRRLSRLLSTHDLNDKPEGFDEAILEAEEEDDDDEHEGGSPEVSEADSISAMRKESAFKGLPCSAQILRSLSYWSGGCPTERSIQNAYIRLIGAAQHFIYIENQFFVSGLEGDHFCSNRIANALVERIRRAAQNKEDFRVMVVMPLLPAFPGKIDDKEASSLRGVMYWQYRSICRGEHSIYHALLKELDDDVFGYIAFYGLRTHNVVGGTPDTEEVYVHSKTMIVDDRSCIIGSANINERSMNGDRDSEIAVLIDDTEMDETVRIADNTMSVGKFAHSFRMKLFEEHFGVSPGTPMYEKYSDPVNRDSWYSMQDQAMRNCQIYESVFGCLPSDNVLSFKQINMQMEPAPKRESFAVTAKNAFNNRPKIRGRGESSDATRISRISMTINNQSPTPSTGPGSPLSLLSPKKVSDNKIVSSPLADDPVTNSEIQPELSPSSPSSSKHKKNGSAPGNQSPHSASSSAANAIAELSPSGDKREDSFMSGMNVNMRDSTQILGRKDELKAIQGHIVYFPLKFLVDEPLEPKLLPSDLFQ